MSSWWRHPLIAAVISAILVFVVAIVAQWLLYDDFLREHGFRLVDPMLAAIMSGLLTSRFLYVERRSRLADLRRFEIIELLNHHIRNALQAIVFDNTTRNQEESSTLNDAVLRIEWVLAEVLPHVQDKHGRNKGAAA